MQELEADGKEDKGAADELRASAQALPRLKFCGDCGEKMMEGPQQCIKCGHRERAQPAPTVAVAFSQPRSQWATQPPPIGTKAKHQQSTVGASSRYGYATPQMSQPRATSQSCGQEPGIRPHKNVGSAKGKPDDQIGGLIGSLLSGPVPLDDIDNGNDRIGALLNGPVPKNDTGKGCGGENHGSKQDAKRSKMTMEKFMDPSKHFQSAAWSASLSR